MPSRCISQMNRELVLSLSVKKRDDLLKHKGGRHELYARLQELRPHCCGPPVILVALQSGANNEARIEKVAIHQSKSYRYLARLTEASVIGKSLVLSNNFHSGSSAGTDGET